MLEEILHNHDTSTSFLLYDDENERINVRVLLQNETLWVTQIELAKLFNTSKQNISTHLKNIFNEQELVQELTVKDFLTVQNEGSRTIRRILKLYNLDAIIAVGYRVNSKKATKFRIWATQILKEFIKKGFVLDDERLKQGEQVFAQDYFQELLERIRSIRTSERKIYQKITDIFAEISIDYDKNSEITQNFYAMIQNKFHFAITGLTAAEIIYQKADHNSQHMGLLTWKNSPKGRILASDVTVAKNYLNEKQIKRLERTISSFFDYIENIIENRRIMKMQDLAESVNKFLSFNEYKVLDSKGKISKAVANQKAFSEYQQFNKNQQIESDFDQQIKKALNQYEKTNKENC